jgi:hypothetical protein
LNIWPFQNHLRPNLVLFNFWDLATLIGSVRLISIGFHQPFEANPKQYLVLKMTFSFTNEFAQNRTNFQTVLFTLFMLVRSMDEILSKFFQFDLYAGQLFWVKKDFIDYLSVLSLFIKFEEDKKNLRFIFSL